MITLWYKKRLKAEHPVLIFETPDKELALFLYTSRYTAPSSWPPVKYCPMLGFHQEKQTQAKFLHV